MIRHCIEIYSVFLFLGITKRTNRKYVLIDFHILLSYNGIKCYFMIGDKIMRELSDEKLPDKINDSIIQDI